MIVGSSTGTITYQSLNPTTDDFGIEVTSNNPTGSFTSADDIGDISGFGTIEFKGKDISVDDTPNYGGGAIKFTAVGGSISGSGTVTTSMLDLSGSGDVTLNVNTSTIVLSKSGGNVTLNDTVYVDPTLSGTNAGNLTLNTNQSSPSPPARPAP